MKRLITIEHSLEQPEITKKQQDYNNKALMIITLVLCIFGIAFALFMSF